MLGADAEGCPIQCRCELEDVLTDAGNVKEDLEMGKPFVTECEYEEKAHATGRNRCFWWKMTFLVMPNVVPATKFNHDQRSEIKFGPRLPLDLTLGSGLRLASLLYFVVPAVA